MVGIRNADSPDDSAKELQVLRDGKVLTFSILSGKSGVLLQNRGIKSTTHPAEESKDAPN